VLVSVLMRNQCALVGADWGNQPSDVVALATLVDRTVIGAMIVAYWFADRSLGFAFRREAHFRPLAGLDEAPQRVARGAYPIRNRPHAPPPNAGHSGPAQRPAQTKRVEVAVSEPAAGWTFHIVVVVVPRAKRSRGMCGAPD